MRKHLFVTLLPTYDECDEYSTQMFDKFARRHAARCESSQSRITLRRQYKNKNPKFYSKKKSMHAHQIKNFKPLLSVFSQGSQERTYGSMECQLCNEDITCTLSILHIYLY